MLYEGHDILYYVLYGAVAYYMVLYKGQLEMPYDILCWGGVFYMIYYIGELVYYIIYYTGRSIYYSIYYTGACYSILYTLGAVAYCMICYMCDMIYDMVYYTGVGVYYMIYFVGP